MTAAESVNKDTAVMGAKIVSGPGTNLVPKYMIEAINMIYAEAANALIRGFLVMFLLWSQFAMVQ